MRFLGIDYGTKKIGLALSDESACFAFPHSILKFTTSQVVRNIKKICDENNVTKIILGRPEMFKVMDDKNGSYSNDNSHYALCHNVIFGCLKLRNVKRV